MKKIVKMQFVTFASTMILIAMIRADILVTGGADYTTVGKTRWMDVATSIVLGWNIPIDASSESAVRYSQTK